MRRSITRCRCTNHYPGVSKTADYKARAQFFDELNAFFNELEKSGRKVMVVVVPEHGER